MTTSTSRGATPFIVVVAGALLAATLDITYACVFWAAKSSVAPSRILQSVAAGLLGSASFQNGAPAAALGFVLHYLMMFLMAFAYYVAARRWPLLQARALLCGGIYGLLLYGVMTYVVVPLSRASTGPNDTLWITLSIAVHVLLIGMPLALFARIALARGATRMAITG